MGLDMASIIASHSLVASNRRNKKEAKEDSFYRDKYRHILTEKQIDILRQIDRQLSNEHPRRSEKKCPECERSFIILTLEDTEFDGCPWCRSFWFDSAELAQVSGEENDIPETALRSRTSRYPCPLCGEIMKEHIYLRGNNLLVDRCPAHGIYLESGELKRAFDALNRKI